MDAQELMVRVAAATINEDNEEMVRLVDVMEDMVKTLPESQTEMAMSLQQQIAAMRGMIAIQSAVPGGQDAFESKLQAAMDSGDEAAVEEMMDQLSAGTDEIAAHFDAMYPPAPPLEANVQRLFDAIEEGDKTATRDALKDVDVNGHYGQFNQTPLYHALSADDRTPEMIKLLLDAGADARIGMDDGYTPLHNIGDYLGGPEKLEPLADIVRLLIDAGADIEARTDSYGWTPLQQAVMQGVPVEIEALLQGGANPNAIYAPHSMPHFSPGRTPLQIAGSRTEKVQVLLNYGADPHQRDAHGQTCMEYLRGELAEKPGLLSKLIGDHGYCAGLQDALDLIESHPRHA